MATVKTMPIEAVTADLEAFRKSLPIAPFKPPKSIAETGDRYYQVRTARLLADKVSEALAAEETFLKDHIINTMPVTQTGVAGKLVRVAVVKKTRFIPKDWEAVWDYIIKNRKKGATALLQRRLNDTAVKEILDTGRTVPGVEADEYKSISVNKL